MKKLTITLLATTIILTACQMSSSESRDLAKNSVIKSDAINKAEPNKALTSTNLENYVWSYQPKDAPVPIKIQFNGQSVVIITGCNNQSGSVKVTDQFIQTSSLVSTQMACSNDLMQNERFSAALFDQTKLNYQLDNTSVEQPRLWLTGSNGVRYEFKGSMTPEARYQSKASIIFLEVSPQTKTCMGVAKQQCLQIREISYDDRGVKTQIDKDWNLFYDTIQGYAHRADQRVVLRIKRYERPNPAADQSKYVYVQDAVIEMEQLTP